MVPGTNDVSNFDNILDRTGESFAANFPSYRQGSETFARKGQSLAVGSNTYRASVKQISPLRHKAQLGMAQRK